MHPTAHAWTLCATPTRFGCPKEANKATRSCLRFTPSLNAAVYKQLREAEAGFAYLHDI